MIGLSVLKEKPLISQGFMAFEASPSVGQVGGQTTDKNISF
jgi:hypothetical protein